MDRTEFDGGFRWGPGDRELVFATNSLTERAERTQSRRPQASRSNSLPRNWLLRPGGREARWPPLAGSGQGPHRHHVRVCGRKCRKESGVPTDSVLVDASPDGGTVLFQDGKGNAYLRRTDGTSLVRLGAAWPSSLSPDGKWVVLFNLGGGHQISLVPTGPGEVKKLPLGDLVAFGGFVLRNGKSVLFLGPRVTEKPTLLSRGHRWRIASRHLGPDQRSQAIFLAESPDGAELATWSRDGYSKIYRLAGGGAPRPIPRFQGWGPRFLEWSEDGKALYIGGGEAIPRRIERLDLETGRRDLWKSFDASRP